MTLPDKSYALNSLDLKLLEYLNFENGFFVECGAADGKRQSNTLYYEEHLGWHGLLIEAVPELYARCKTERPAALIENAALVSPEYKEDRITIRYCGLMSMVKGALGSEEEEQARIARGLEVQKIKESYSVDVPAKTISALLDKHCVDKIDFFSLDVEGYEYEAIQGLDLSRHRPWYILIEHAFSDQNKIAEYLNPFYILIDRLSDIDFLYKRTS